MSSQRPADAPPKSVHLHTPLSTSRTVFNSAWPLVAGIVLAVALHFTVPNALGPYYTKITIDCGIAIILAVSLNIVNGMTGQFSLGHAAFMALGGYVAGIVTYYGSMLLWDTAARNPTFLGAGEWLFVLGCFVGGLTGILAGYVVGLPSLRLRGDYLAIVTLGFGEILRVLFQQTNPVIDNANELHSAGMS